MCVMSAAAVAAASQQQGWEQLPRAQRMQAGPGLVCRACRFRLPCGLGTSARWAGCLSGNTLPACCYVDTLVIGCRCCTSRSLLGCLGLSVRHGSLMVHLVVGAMGGLRSLRAAGSSPAAAQQVPRLHACVCLACAVVLACWMNCQVVCKSPGDGLCGLARQRAALAQLQLC